MGALPTRQLQRIEDLDARSMKLAAQRKQITRGVEDLPQPRRRLGREQDTNSIERAHLTGALQAADCELDAAASQRQRLAKELGDPSDIRAKRDALQRTLSQLTREHAERALGERPVEPQMRKPWEQAVREAAGYRLQYDVTDPNDPLGAPPLQRERERDWQQPVTRSTMPPDASAVRLTTTTTVASTSGRRR